MASERIGTFVYIYRVNYTGTILPWRRYQNFAQGKRIEFSGQKFDFLPFIYSGSTISRTGDNVAAEITMSSNILTNTNVAVLMERTYKAKVWVCRMDAEFEEVKQILTEDHWSVSSAVYDTQATQLILSSGLDAVGSDIPKRVLTTNDVGPLPVSGNIQL